MGYWIVLLEMCFEGCLGYQFVNMWQDIVIEINIVMGIGNDCDIFGIGIQDSIEEFDYMM